MNSQDEEVLFPEHLQFADSAERSANKILKSSDEEIRLYLIAKIWSHAHSWNEQVVSKLRKPLSVFVPHQHNPYNTTAQSFKQAVHDIDLEAICNSQGAILLPPYGNDCSYEVGAYKMMNIVYGRGNIAFPVIAVVQNETNFLKDWMVKAGITHVITDSSQTYRSIIADPMLSAANRKVFKIDSLDELHDIVMQIVLKTREVQNSVVRMAEEKLLDFPLTNTRPQIISQDA